MNLKPTNISTQLIMTLEVGEVHHDRKECANTSASKLAKHCVREDVRTSQLTMYLKVNKSISSIRSQDFSRF